MRLQLFLAEDPLADPGQIALLNVVREHGDIDLGSDKNGKVIEGEGGSIEGYRATGVPGTVRGMELALKKYGSGKLT